MWVAAVLIVSGCTGRAGGASPSITATSDGTRAGLGGAGAGSAWLGCRDVIASAVEPSPDLSVVFDQVALPTRRALQANHSGDADSAVRWFAKVGLFVSRGASFELIVPNEWLGHLSMAWGSTTNRTTHLAVLGCPANEAEKRWSVYAGGFYVKDPACVSLLVKSGAREESVHIGVGAACSGQEPPPPGQ